MQVGSLGQEDPPAEEVAAHSSILAWRIPWTEEPSGPQSKVWQRAGHNWALLTVQKSNAETGVGERVLEARRHACGEVLGPGSARRSVLPSLCDHFSFPIRNPHQSCPRFSKHKSVIPPLSFFEHTDK